MYIDFKLNAKVLVSYSSFINYEEIISTKELLAYENNVATDDINVAYIPSKKEFHQLMLSLQKKKGVHLNCNDLNENMAFEFFKIKNSIYKQGAICTRLLDLKDDVGTILMDYFIVIPLTKEGYLNYSYRDYCTDTSFVNSRKISLD